MNVTTTALEGVLLLKPRVFADDRGHFLETFSVKAFQAATGLSPDFVQDNESSSKKGVLRGLHFQLDPHAQGKLVRVVRGAVLDVAVDIRPGSSTYGQHVKERLDEHNKHLLWIPPGLAHGFVALEDDTLFAYKCTGYYHQPSERTIRWDDPTLAIDWGVTSPLVSPKDAQGFALDGAWAERTT